MNPVQIPATSGASPDNQLDFSRLQELIQARTPARLLVGAPGPLTERRHSLNFAAITRGP